MAKKKLALKIEHSSIPFLYLILVVPLLIAVLAQFKVITLTLYVPAILTILTSLFVMSEVGVMGMIRGKKLGKDKLRIGGVFVAAVAIILAALSLFMGTSGVTGFFGILQGVFNVLLIIYVVIEGFR